MTCPSYPNPISMVDISNEFGRGQTTMSITEYYANGSRVRPGTVGYPLGNPTQIPGGGSISLGNFHGATRISMYKFYGSQGWTIPPGMTYPLVLAVGGGGGGGSTYGYTGFGALPPGGGGGGAGGVWLGRFGTAPGQGTWIEVGGGGGGGGASPNGRGGNGGNTVWGPAVAYGGGGGGGALVTTVQEYQAGYWQNNGGGNGKDGSGGMVWVPGGYVNVQRVIGSGADGASGGGACVIQNDAVPGNPSQGQRGGYPINFGGAAWNGGGGGFNQRGGDGGVNGSYGGQGILINMDNFEQVWVAGGGGAGNHFIFGAVIPGGTGGGGNGGGVGALGAQSGQGGTGGGGGGGGAGFGGNGGSGTVWVLG